MPTYVAEDIILALEQFKYWFDGPPEYDREQNIKENNTRTEMTFSSENHVVQFSSAQVLVGNLLENTTFPRSSPTDEMLTGTVLAPTWYEVVEPMA